MTILHPLRFATRLDLAWALAFLLLCGAAGPAAAQYRTGIDELFTARDVPVDETAGSAAEARDVAIREGQEEALARVLRRITPPDQHDRLPQPSDAEIAAMVDEIQVENEKTSARRYLSNLTISFKRSAVRGLLRRDRIPFSETRAKPTLVLPVLRAGNGPRLFDDTNPWWQAWRALDLDPSALLPLVLPLGDIEDLTLLSAEQAVAGDTAALDAIGDRHGVERVLVALATARGAAAPGASGPVEVTLLRYGPNETGFMVDRFLVPGGAEIEAVMTAAAAEAAARLQEDWKRETLIEFGDAATLVARVPLDGPGAWVAVRERLQRNPTVRRLELTAISRREARVVLHYLGDPGQLSMSLAQDSLALEGVSGFWVIKRAGGGAGAAASRTNGVRTRE